MRSRFGIFSFQKYISQSFSDSRSAFLVLFVFFAFFAALFIYMLARTEPIVSDVRETLQDNDSAKLDSLDVSKLRQESLPQSSVFFDRDAPAPTNRWFSSVAFSETSEPIFAYPLAIKMNSDGFGISYPNVVSTADTVFGSYNPDISVSFQDSDIVSSVGSFYDLSAEILLDAYRENRLGSIRVSHGSPYIFASIAPHETLHISGADMKISKTKNNARLFSVKGKWFAFFFDPESIVLDEGDPANIRVSTGDSVAQIAFAVLPSQFDFDLFEQYAFNPIVSTKTTWSVDTNNNSVMSRFDFITKNGGETLVGLLPKQYRSFVSSESRQVSAGKYNTIRGEQRVYVGSTFEFSKKLNIPPMELDISRLSSEEKGMLQDIVRSDVAHLSVVEQDTYFLGKKLFSLANLLNLSEQLNMSNESGILVSKLRTELETWRMHSLSSGLDGAGEKYFSYDPVIRGIVGKPSSFGSDRFNDHHFHYGYFIYAASMLARYDSEYLRENELFINLLVKDIANIDRNDPAFPYIRGFDFYEGHSWASGDGLFADGNNQESSSEAVNAWYAVYLWSEVIHHKALQDMSLALYAEESSSALEYWLNIDRTDSRFSNFRHAFVSLLWGGKLDSATWFSPKPEAKLGIQILPLSPGSEYLGENTGRVRENISSEVSLRNPTLFKDYLIAYTAFFDPVEAERQLDALADADIDGANSRSFLKAWILVKKNKMSNASNL